MPKVTEGLNNYKNVRLFHHVPTFGDEHRKIELAVVFSGSNSVNTTGKGTYWVCAFIKLPPNVKTYKHVKIRWQNVQIKA